MGVGGHHSSFRRLSPSRELLFNGMILFTLSLLHPPVSPPMHGMGLSESQFAHFEEIQAFLCSLSEFNSFRDLNSAGNGLNQNYMADLQNT